MINTNLKTLFLVSLVAISSCSSPQPEQRAVPVNMIKPTVTVDIEISALASDRDPVCKMSLKDGVADTATVNGKLYGFCSEGCKKEYVMSYQKKESDTE